jgi:hypothetical protein
VAEVVDRFGRLDILIKQRRAHAPRPNRWCRC